MNPVKWWLGADFLFVVWSTWIICTLLIVLLVSLSFRMQQPLPVATVRIACGRHRARGRLGTRRADERYSADYLTEVISSSSLLPSWGPTAPCQHSSWTRTLDVVVNGGDE